MRGELFVDGDPIRLAQVIGNLLTHAARYMPARGHVWLSAAREGDAVVIRVLDNGMGIPPEVLPRIFDLFVQGPRAIDRREGGLGLGLALVKNLVGLHGGTVSAHSRGPGLGSEFVVRVPILRDARPVARATPGRPDQPRRGRRILVVDDNVDAASELAETLAVMGHEVADLGLPVMDGYELATQMRRAAVKPLRLIALTG